MKKRLSLKKETLSRLDNDELAEVVAGTYYTFLCEFTGGNSCGSVCSGYCPSYTCPPATAIVELVTNTIR